MTTADMTSLTEAREAIARAIHDAHLTAYGVTWEWHRPALREQFLISADAVIATLAPLLAVKGASPHD